MHASRVGAARKKASEDARGKVARRNAGAKQKKAPARAKKARAKGATDENQPVKNLEVGVIGPSSDSTESTQTEQPTHIDADLEKECCEMLADRDTGKSQNNGSAGGAGLVTEAHPELQVESEFPDEKLGEAAVAVVQQGQQTEAQQKELLESAEAKAKTDVEGAEIDVKEQAEKDRVEATIKEKDEQLQNRLQAVRVKAEADERQRCSRHYMLCVFALCK